MPARQPNEPISDCVSRAMSIISDEPKYNDLTQEQRLGRAYGICKEMQKDQALTTQSPGAHNPRHSEDEDEEEKASFGGGIYLDDNCRQLKDGTWECKSCGKLKR